MNRKSEVHDFVVSYRGRDYPVQYVASSEFVDVEVAWGQHHQKTTRQLGGMHPKNIARIAAIEILRVANENGLMD